MAPLEDPLTNALAEPEPKRSDGSPTVAAEGPGCTRSAWLDRHRRSLIGALALLATLRLGVLALSLPFFSHLDEAAHIDVVYKYAHGELPSADDDLYEPEVLELFMLWNAPGYVFAADANPIEILPAYLEPELRAEYLRVQRRSTDGVPNHEAFQPPAYYAAAAAWWWLGRAFDVHPITNLYWLRLLGALAFGVTILISHRFLFRVLPDRPTLWFGVPLLLAVFPQDIFVCVNNDIGGLLLGALALDWLWRLREGRPGPAAGAKVGAVLALGLLVKPTALPLLVVAALLIPWRAAHRALPALGATFALPLVVWYSIAWLTTGEPTGTIHKVGILGFEAQDRAGFFAHPLWSIDGSWTFFSSLIPSFWRGDLHWASTLLRHEFVDWVYLGTTIVLVVTGLVLRTTPSASADATQRLVRACRFGLLAGIAMLVALSLAWRFGDNPFPSDDHPFFSNGRLLTALIVPFLIVYVDGLDRASRRLAGGGTGGRVFWIVLAALAALATCSEVLLATRFASDPHNFWNLQLDA